MLENICYPQQEVGKNELDLDGLGLGLVDYNERPWYVKYQ